MPRHSLIVASLPHNLTCFSIVRDDRRHRQRARIDRPPSPHLRCRALISHKSQVPPTGGFCVYIFPPFSLVSSRFLSFSIVQQRSRGSRGTIPPHVRTHTPSESSESSSPRAFALPFGIANPLWTTDLPSNSQPGGLSTCITLLCSTFLFRRAAIVWHAYKSISARSQFRGCTGPGAVDPTWPRSEHMKHLRTCGRR